LNRAAQAFAFAAALTAAGATHGAPAPEAKPAKPNILLLSVDTLRADRLSLYGNEHPTSPFIAELAGEGLRFEHAYATSSWTVPSVVSMLTGVYRHGMGQRLAGSDRSWSVIPESLPTLAQVLQAAGYRTFGLTANLNVPAERGFDRGFDRFLCIGSRDSDEVEVALGPWLKDIASAEPWFVWVHLFDPHGPYRSRQPWAAQFDPEVERYEWLDGFRTETWASRAKHFPTPIIKAALALYDSEIRYADEYVRRLFEALPAARKAFVLFTSDHGEEFLEHGGTLHGGALYEESIRIPLVVRFPDRRLAGTVVHEAVSLVDVMPTVAGIAGAESVPPTDGIRLFGPDGVAVPGDRVVFSELLRGARGSVRAMVDGRWKLIASDGRGDPQLFDLQQDPGEQVDLADSHPEVLARFAGALADFEKIHLEPADDLEQAPVTPETIEQLKALGYVD